MEKDKYLNEESFQKTKGKVIRLALIVLICGVLLGGGLITIGIKSAKGVDSKSNNRTEKVIQADIDKLNTELITLKAQLTKEFEKNNFSEEYYRLQDEVAQKQRKLGKLEDELWKVETGYNATKKSIEKGKAIPFYMIGGFIIIASCMASSSIYMFAKRREIVAFTTQQVMPVAKEGIEKMTPTISNTAKEIAKGITAGIEEGKNNK